MKNDAHLTVQEAADLGFQCMTEPDAIGRSIELLRSASDQGHYQATQNLLFMMRHIAPDRFIPTDEKRLQARLAAIYQGPWRHLTALCAPVLLTRGFRKRANVFLRTTTHLQMVEIVRVYRWCDCDVSLGKSAASTTMPKQSMLCQEQTLLWCLTGNRDTGRYECDFRYPVVHEHAMQAIVTNLLAAGLQWLEQPLKQE